MHSLYNSLSSIIPSRSLNYFYIIIDSLFILFFVFLLFYKKRHEAAIVGFMAGILYFIVDYVFFYHVSHSRVVIIGGENASEWGYVLYLLWHELSSGITNFALLWLAVSKDKDLKLWLFLVFSWWLLAPAIAELGDERTIVTYRTTTAYHGWMALIATVGYFGLIIYNFLVPKEKRVNVLWLFLIGFGIQFVWEGAFLLYGIRPWNDSSFATLIIDSLVETNLGMPYLYVLHRLYTRLKERVASKKSSEREMILNK